MRRNAYYPNTVFPCPAGGNRERGSSKDVKYASRWNHVTAQSSCPVIGPLAEFCYLRLLQSFLPSGWLTAIRDAAGAQVQSSGRIRAEGPRAATSSSVLRCHEREIVSKWSCWMLFVRTDRGVRSVSPGESEKLGSLTSCFV